MLTRAQYGSLKTQYKAQSMPETGRGIIRDGGVFTPSTELANLHGAQHISSVVSNLTDLNHQMPSFSSSHPSTAWSC
jgi:hypothetical protein